MNRLKHLALLLYIPWGCIMVTVCCLWLVAMLLLRDGK